MEKITRALPIILSLILLVLILPDAVANNQVQRKQSIVPALRKLRIANAREITSVSEVSSTLPLLKTDSNSRSLQQQKQDECNLTQDHPMSGSIVLDLFGEPHLFTSKEYDEIGKAIVQTYNAINNCGVSGQYRQIQSFQLGPISSFENLGKRSFTLEYMLSGSCRGCNSTNSHMFYHVDVNGRNEDTCPCQGPSITTFQIILTERLDALIQDRVLTNLDALDLAGELKSAPSCPAFSTFTTSDAVIQLYGCPLTFQDSDWNSLAELFKETYNRINSLNAKLCDRFFREIVSATVIVPPDGFSWNQQQAEDTRSRRHRLQRSMESKMADWSPSGRSLDDSTATFQCPDYFEVQFDITARCRGCDVGDATLFDQEEDVNFFQSNADYYMDNDDDTDDKDDNNGNGSDTSGEGDVDGIGNSGSNGGQDDDVSSNGGDENGDDSGDDERRRTVVENDSNVGIGDKSKSSDQSDDIEEWGDSNDNTQAVTDSQSSGNDDRDRGRTAMQRDSREWDDIESNTIIGSWSGRDENESIGSNIGRGSNAESKMNDASGGSRGGETNKTRNRRGRKTASASSKIRSLDAETSDCRCSVDPKFRAVTESEMVSAFNHAITYSSDVSDLLVEDVIEVEKVQCNPNIDSFQTIVDVSFDSDSDDGVITPELANTLTQTFIRSYNTLADRFCDPYFREVKGAEIMEQWSTPVRRNRELQGKKPIAVKFNFNFRFVVAGACRACPARKLFGNDAPKRRLADSASGKYRRLQTADQCFCATANIADSAPTEREFAESYNEDFAAFIFKLGNQYNVSKVNEKVTGPDAVQNPRIECAVAKDCIDAKKGTLCVNNACLHEGNPRITLTWVGDDDLDLSVYTPGGVKIAYDADFDSETGGSFDTLFSQDVFAPHVESIFFPISGGPSGTYSIMVDSYEQRGSPDAWTIEVFTAAGESVPVFVKNSTGSQDEIFFYFGDNLVDPNSDVCSITDAHTECCVNEDCIVTDAFARRCVNRQCITEGARTFTLSWTGNDKYALNVVVPDTTIINAQAPNEVLSGGRFEPDKNAAISGDTFHTQSVYFPHGHPTGEYIFFVDMITQNGIADEWRIEMTEFGTKIFAESGTGVSNAFSYTAAECVVDTNCGANQVCIFSRCIVDGSPRFTLTWSGDDDYDLSVDPPNGNTIDWANAIDQKSGGELQDDSDPYGWNHVESVYFGVASKAQLGQYRLRVRTYQKNGFESDSWTLKIIVRGKVIRSWSQTGDATFRWRLAGT